MRFKQELAKCQMVVDSAIKGYLNLIERKNLLEQSIATAKNDFKSLTPNLKKSIKTIQDTLYSSLLIDIHAWLFDAEKKSSNRSTYNLQEKLKREDFKNELEKYYVTPPNTILLSESVNIKWQQDYIETKTEEFHTLLQTCLNSYKSLLESDLGVRIKNIRSKLLAHKDGDYQMGAHQIDEAIEAMDSMRKIVLSLNALLQKCSYPIGETEEVSKRNAQLFWNHVAKT